MLKRSAQGACGGGEAPLAAFKVWQPSLPAHRRSQTLGSFLIGYTEALNNCKGRGRCQKVPQCSTELSHAGRPYGPMPVNRIHGLLRLGSGLGPYDGHPWCNASHKQTLERTCCRHNRRRCGCAAGLGAGPKSRIRQSQRRRGGGRVHACLLCGKRNCGPASGACPSASCSHGFDQAPSLQPVGSGTVHL